MSSVPNIKEIRGVEPPIPTTGVYVLELKSSKFYVGASSKGVEARIRSHFNGGSAEWTKKHEPISVVEIVECSEDEVWVFERYKTKELMLKYGWKNVRGGPWSDSSMTKGPGFLKLQ